MFYIYSIYFWGSFFLFIDLVYTFSCLFLKYCIITIIENIFFFKDQIMGSRSPEKEFHVNKLTGKSYHSHFSSIWYFSCLCCSYCSCLPPEWSGFDHQHWQNCFQTSTAWRLTQPQERGTKKNLGNKDRRAWYWPHHPTCAIGLRKIRA